MIDLLDTRLPAATPVPGESLETLTPVVDGAIRQRDAVNGPMMVSSGGLLLFESADGGVYRVVLRNDGGNDVYLAIGQPATTDSFPLFDGETLTLILGGGLRLWAVSGVASPGTRVRVWVNQLLA